MQLEEFTKLMSTKLEIMQDKVRSTGLGHYIEPFYPGLGEAVARRTYLRGNETWEQLCDRVTLGNFSLHPYAHVVGFSKHKKSRSTEPLTDEMIENKRFELILRANTFNRLMKKGLLIASGRHQQHGDLSQADRNMEVFTNCATAASSSVMNYLLLCGSGVGRAYDDDLMITDWRNAPKVVPILDMMHPDNDGRWFYDGDFDEIVHVGDSREGWAKALMVVESLAFSGAGREKTILMDFSGVRPEGSPIAGMQNKPSSGPVPMMESFLELNKLVQIAKLTDMPLWEQAMRVDHIFAAYVLFGGARRSARMATKWYKDKDIERFITIKNQGGLWSSNNSVTVDQEFWDGVDKQDHHCLKVLRLLTHNAYFQNSGEPGIINVDRLDQGVPDKRTKQNFHIGNDKFQLTPQLKRMYDKLFDIVAEKKYKFITNPCGEISQHILGAFCVIFDINAAKAADWDELMEAALLAPEFLFNVNEMESIYSYEVQLTNRIGIGLTGIHEFAAKQGLDFNALITASNPLHDIFWANVRRIKHAINDECERLARERNLNVPVANTTIKPSGSVSKPWNVTEGAHLPPALYWMRWVQYEKSNPLIQEYVQRGYPVETLKSYPNTVVVGFPTKTGMLDYVQSESDITLAGDATVDQQYAWVKLLEENWLGEKGQQVSYTCKYDPKKTSYDQIYESIKNNQRNVKCFTIMPQIDQSAYEYQPEELISKATYEGWVQHIEARHKAANLDHIKEDIDLEGLICAGGACPIM